MITSAVMDWSHVAATTLIVALTLKVFFLPPIVVLIRRTRPWIVPFGILSWLVLRLSPFDPQKTLLQVIEDLLAISHDFMVHWLAQRGVLLEFLQFLWTLTEDLMAIVMLCGMYRILYKLSHYSLQEWKDIVVDAVFQWFVQHVALVGRELEKETAKFASEMESSFGKDPNRSLTLNIPEKGRTHESIVQELEPFATKENASWQHGRVSGTVYMNRSKHTQLMNTVYGLYSWSNPLHPGAWPKLNQCEGEVIAMVGRLVNLDHPHGVISSGGTESIVLAIRAHLNVYGRARGIRYPELICGSSVHASVLKACEMFGIRRVEIDCSRFPYRLDEIQVERHITANTIMIYTSAPSYPQGVIDPIEAFSRLAQKYDIGLHVDACLGGFVLPFLEDIPPFDFACPGVTSMSLDTHKYGYATKGTSVLLCRHDRLRHGHYFSYSRWSGGLYTTPTIAGSRPGGLVSCAWASLVATGMDGYQRHAESIVKAARMLAEGVQMLRGVKLLTVPPISMVVCIGSDEFDIYAILDCLTKSGWTLNSLQNPPCLHICVTLNVVPKVDSFLRDLKMSIGEVRNMPRNSKKGTAGIYGAVGSLPPGPVNHTLNVFTDLALAP